jgi:multidrug transporter EmrE-like cation transporter
MPSLIGTTVAANYLKTNASTQFGTRALRIIKIAISGGSNNMTLVDGSTADTGSVAGYTLANSLFSKAIRSLQAGVEIYAVFTPAAGSFTAIISDTTANDSDSGNAPGVLDSAAYGDLEAAIAGALNASAVVAITTGSITGVTLS